LSKKHTRENKTHLIPGDDVPEPDCEAPVMFVDVGRSVSDSIRGLSGGMLELLPSSSSMSPSLVMLGDDESLLSPSSFWVRRKGFVIRTLNIRKSYLIATTTYMIASIALPLIFL